MKKTKIVCTLGPATDEGNILQSMINSGMNVARLNFSHGDHEEHLGRVKKIRKLRKELNIPIALLLDTKGPEIRVKDFKDGKVHLTEGQTFTLTTQDIPGDETKVSVTYNELPNDVKKEDRILLDDGLMELKVLAVTKTDVECQVINGGTLGSKKGVNVPGVTLNLPFVSERDKKDLLFAIKEDFDFVAASFVRSSSDIKEMRKFLEDSGAQNIKIISKIENRDGVNNIDDIIRVSNGVMVARGDMGVEIPFEELPPIQKAIIRKAFYAGKPAITATQMLDSMIRNPRPTRAEITDVANAIYDGTSAIMLSGETSIGKYPVESVQTMAKIARETEQNIDYISRFENFNFENTRSVTNAISQATVTSAHTLGAAAIVSVTESGQTARMVSKYRPACPIIAPTDSEKVYRQLAMSWGVMPVLMQTAESTDALFDQAVEKATETGVVKNGDLIVITGGFPTGVSGTTNTVRIHIVGDVLVEGKGLNKFIASGNVCVLDRKSTHELKRNVQEKSAGTVGALKDFTAGNILVLYKSIEEILPVIKYAAGIITEEDSEDSQAAIVAKALEIPIITNALNATEILKSGLVVTVNAEKGMVFSGVKEN